MDYVNYIELNVKQPWYEGNKIRVGQSLTTIDNFLT